MAALRTSEKRPVYRIAEWNDRYEPALRGHRHRGRSKLEWFKCKVAGSLRSRGWNRLLVMCGQPGDLTGYINPLAVLGAFVYCCEFAAEVDANHRDGTIYNDRGEPATLEWMAEAAGVPVEAFAKPMELLTSPKLGWVLYSSKVNRSESVRISQNRSKARLDETETERKTKRTTAKKSTKEDSMRTRRASQDPKPNASEKSSLQGTSLSASGKANQGEHPALLATRAVLIMELVKTFNVNIGTEQGRRDKTTFERIAIQLVLGPTKQQAANHAGAVFDLAQSRAGKGRRPVAMFVAACKKELSYKGKRKD